LILKGIEPFSSVLQ